MKLQSATIMTAAVLVTITMQPVSADMLTCGRSGISISHENEAHAEMVCNAVRTSETLFEQCNVPAVSSAVRIEIVDDLREGCTAVYHCGEDRIEVLTPPAMQERREEGGAFSHLGLEEYFHSVVVHELTHAATDDMPCPYQACVAAAEYIAYVLQVMSLDPDERAEFEANSAINRRISTDELSPIILYMAPDLFSQKAWAHFSQRDDPCGYIGQLVDGTIIIDTERF